MLPVSVYAETPLGELANFRTRPGAEFDPIADWRVGPQDDLVLAVAIAVWDGQTPVYASSISLGQANEFTALAILNYLVRRSSKISITTADKSWSAGTAKALTVKVICLGMVLSDALPFGAGFDFENSGPSTFTKRAVSCPAGSHD
jgi:hypothetical protein